MKQFLLVCISLLFIGSSLLTAQEWDAIEYGTIGAHYQQLDFSAFNEQVKALGYPALEEEMVDITGGWTQHKGAWKTHFAFALGINENFTGGNGPETKYQHAGFLWSTSYNLLNASGTWFVGPEIQILLQGEQMVLSGQDQAPSIGSAIDTEYTKLTRFGSPVDIGLNVHRAIKFSPNKPNFMIVGLRTGYRLDTDTSWQLDQAVDIRDSGINPGGFYAGLVIGIRLY
ncbi:hypothetical protein [Lewinella cohaerens]|uniref:hypothetical protein n=1 Tax=Lewinella cohaerens TaxID=70995 RepID=UPI000380AF16|nr:hypothetical protein [Lewinella cohaerens]